RAGEGGRVETCGARMGRRIGGRHERIGTLQYRAGPGMLVHRLVLATDRQQQREAVDGRWIVIGELLGTREEIADGEGLARRRGVEQQERVEVVDRDAARERREREVALVGGGAGGGVGAQALRVGERGGGARARR